MPCSMPHASSIFCFDTSNFSSSLLRHCCCCDNQTLGSRCLVGATKKEPSIHGFWMWNNHKCLIPLRWKGFILALHVSGARFWFLDEHFTKDAEKKIIAMPISLCAHVSRRELLHIAACSQLQQPSTLTTHTHTHIQHRWLSLLASIKSHMGKMRPV